MIGESRLRLHGTPSRILLGQSWRVVTSQGVASVAAERVYQRPRNGGMLVNPAKLNGFLGDGTLSDKRGFDFQF